MTTWGFSAPRKVKSTMTFSILARDETGALGQAVSSSSPAVAARCLNLRCDIGAVSSQNITDPRFGPALLDQLEKGETAVAALKWLETKDDTLDFRQITILPARGEGVSHSGAKTLGTHSQVVGKDCVIAGNMLASEDVPQKMLEVFESVAGDLEYRLLAAMKAGLEAGGEAGPVHSAGLGVVRNSGWMETDLRVDWSERPLTDLENLLEIWMPQRDDYVTRGINPSTAPAYGVPGDE